MAMKDSKSAEMSQDKLESKAIDWLVANPKKVFPADMPRNVRNVLRALEKKRIISYTEKNGWRVDDIVGDVFHVSLCAPPKKKT